MYSSVNFNAGVRLCICHHNQDTEQFHHPKRLPCIIPLSHPSPQPLANTDLFSITNSFVFSRMSWKRNHTVGNFWDWLLSLSLMLLWLIQVMCISSSFFSIAEYYSIVQNITDYTTTFTTEGHLGYFQLGQLWIERLWLFVYRFCVNIVFISLGKYLAMGLLGHIYDN